MSWVQKLDNTFWATLWGTAHWNSPVAGAWFDDGLGSGLSQTDDGGLAAISTWAVGYRPANMRLTMSVASGSVVLRVKIENSSGSYLSPGHIAPSTITVTTTPTAFVFPLDFSAIGVQNMDIADFDIFQVPNSQGNWTLTISNIEFGDSSAGAFWQDYVKTTEVDA